MRKREIISKIEKWLKIDDSSKSFKCPITTKGCSSEIICLPYFSRCRKVQGYNEDLSPIYDCPCLCYTQKYV